jgi:dihydroorotase
MSLSARRPAARGPRDLPHTMAKFLGLGLPLTEVLRAVTATSAAVLGRTGEPGTLRPGAAGDVAVFERRGGAVDPRG